MVKRVQKIEKTKLPARSDRKLNVAIYCRVSTGTDEQASSLQSQIGYYTKYVNSHVEWELAGVFADSATGLSVKDRPEFRKMLRQCETGKIDMIICKSISRFGRNLRDSLNVLEDLRQKDIGVWFDDLQANSLDPKLQTVLAMYMTYAQDESLNKGKNVRWGIRKGFENGTSGFANVQCYGYRRNEEGDLYLEYGEAHAVRLIFEWFLDGESLRQIAGNLEERQVLSPSGKEHWSPAALGAILKNRKYTGDVILQKTYVADTLHHTVKQNQGELEQFLIEDNHRPIISREIFFAAQDEMERRGKGKKPGSRYSSKGLSGWIVCGECGRNYQRITRTRGGQKIHVWRCASRLEKGNKSCLHSSAVDEMEIRRKVMDELYMTEWDEKTVRKTVECVVIQDDDELQISRKNGGCAREKMDQI